jgi:hypothetical protein
MSLSTNCDGEAARDRAAMAGKTASDPESSRQKLIRVIEPGVNQALDDSENKSGRNAEL